MQKESITKKFKRLLLISAAVSVSLFIILFLTVNFVLDSYFNASSFRTDRATYLVDKFQAYVTTNNISSTDTEDIQDWAFYNGIVYMNVSGEDILMDESSYYDGIPPSQRNDLHYALPGQFTYRVDFYDMSAAVFLYDNIERYYFWGAYILIALLSGLNGYLILLWGIKDEVQYITELSDEVDKMNTGLENANFRIEGNDEISSLAKTIENMRTSLIDKEQKELEMKKAQDNLVLGMAHDLRTPLTSLMAYIEIVKRQNKTEEVLKYSDKAMQKAEEIKNLSNQLFDFFLINSGEKDEFEVAGIEYAFTDHLSELCNYLESQSFTVEATDLTWPHQNVSISFDYIGRIMNNIQSNIIKYADKAKPVILSTKSDGKCFYISIQNAVSDHADDSSSNGIGLKNINSMMKKMGGDCIIHTDKTDFSIELIFIML